MGGIEHDVERRRAHAANNAAQDERSSRCKDRRNKEVDRWRQSLDERNCYVQTAGQWTKQEAAHKARLLDEQLSEQFERSTRHMNACRSWQDLQLDAQRLKTREREHEVRRVARMNEHERLRKESALQEDSVMFQKCLQLRDMHTQLAHIVS